ncbi:hypothetical protein DFH11DRAFT_1035164 [Phellopilus nigrolimitatus]|nr:hypothetical protein DFH11DRAFT_1035164 [Phellopilus nigrolimitatus]
MDKINPASKKRARQGVECNSEDHGAAGSKNRNSGKPRGSSTKNTAPRGQRKNAKVGRLVLLMQMPVDVFYEVACYLTPGDLLNLTRTTQSWRSLLMTNRSKPIWRAARNNVALPECPDDLSEPQYADLLYGKGCFLCDAPLAKNVYFAFRLRLCKQCFYANTHKGVNIASRYGGELWRDQTIYRLSPYYGGYYVLGSSEEDIQDTIDGGFCTYMGEKFEEVLDIFVELHGQEKTEFVKAKTEYVNKIGDQGKHARLVDAWIKDESKRKEDEKNATARRRRIDIYAKLRDLGYNDADFSIHDCEVWDYYRWHQLTEEPKDLTDRIWKRIKPELEQLLSSRRYMRSGALFDDSESDSEGEGEGEDEDEGEGQDQNEEGVCGLEEDRED